MPAPEVIQKIYVAVLPTINRPPPPKTVDHSFSKLTKAIFEINLTHCMKNPYGKDIKGNI